MESSATIDFAWQKSGTGGGAWFPGPPGFAGPDVTKRNVSNTSQRLWPNMSPIALNITTANSYLYIAVSIKGHKAPTLTRIIHKRQVRSFEVDWLRQ